MTQRVSLIWAMTRNRVIGNGGSLPWDLPDEMAHFRHTTLGSPVIMGRRTFQSMNRPLPDRHNIVLSRRGLPVPRGVTVAADLDTALRRAGSGDCYVIGGAGPYAEALPRAHRLIATFIDAEIEGDTLFPPFDFDGWQIVDGVYHPADDRHAYAFETKTFVRD